MADEFDLIASQLGGQAAEVAPSIDPFDAIAGQLQEKYGGVTEEPKRLPEEETGDSLSFGNVARPVVRGGARGLFGLGSILPEALLSGGKLLAEEGPIAASKLFAPGYAPLLEQKLRGAVPYEYGGFMEKFSEDVNKRAIDPILPKQPGDIDFIETASEYATPGLGVLGLARKAKNVAKAPQILKTIAANPKQEVAATLAGSLGGATGREIDPENPTTELLMAGGAGLFGSHVAGTADRVRKVAGAIKNRATQEAASSVVQRVKEGASKLSQELPGKTEKIGEELVLQRLKNVLGEEGLDNLASRLDELPKSKGASKYATLGEKLNEPKLLGLEEQLAKTTDEGKLTRIATDKKREAARLEDLQGRVPEIDGASETVKAGLTKKAQTEKEAYQKIYKKIDPKGTARITYLKEKGDFRTWLREEAPLGFEGKPQKIIDQFLSGKANPGGNGKANNTQSWRFLQDLRSRARAEQRRIFKEAGEGTKEGLALQKVVDGIDAAGERAASTGKGFTPKQAKLWEQATTKRREWASNYKTGLTEKVIKEGERGGLEPSKIAPEILRPGTPKERVAKLFQNVPKKDMPAWRRALLDEVEAKSINRRTGKIQSGALAKNVGELVEKAGDVFTPSHKEALSNLVKEIQTGAEARATGKVFASSGPAKPQNLFDYAKTIMRSRLGWKYPVERKVIQIIAQKNKLSTTSLEDIMETKLIKFLNDEDFAKELLKKRSPAEMDALLAKGQGVWGKVNEWLGSVTDLASKALKGTKNYAIKETEKTGARLFGPAGAEGSRLFNLKDAPKLDIRDLLQPRPNTESEKKKITLNNPEKESTVEVSDKAIDFIKKKDDSKVNISTRGLNYLKGIEKLRLETYDDGTGTHTIGYGHTGPAVARGKITREEAEALLREDIAKAEEAVSRLVKTPLKQNQYDALVSLVFNIGPTYFAESQLLKKLNEGDFEGAAEEFPKWRKSKGKVLAGLERRREEERSLFEA